MPAMEPLTRLEAVAAPMRRINIDTDAIIPSREMKRVSKDGLGQGLFAGWRYVGAGSRDEDPEFVLNRRPFRDAKILLAGENFGCGSSREHAVWALREWGIRCIIAPSFGAIFAANCVRNGLLPLVLPDDEVEQLATFVGDGSDHAKLTVDLEVKTVTADASLQFHFDIAEADRQMLLQGLDPIALTLQHLDDIVAFEKTDNNERPWAAVVKP